DNRQMFAGMTPMTSLLPFFGPLLILLLLAKLFRPKEPRDFWALHLIGLMQVALACVLTGEPMFGALLVAYLLCGVCSLALFYLHREQQDAGGSTQYAVRSPAPVPWRTLGLWLTGRWSLVILFFGLLLFLVVPRADEVRWDPFNLSALPRKFQMGIEQGIDL